MIMEKSIEIIFPAQFDIDSSMQMRDQSPNASLQKHLIPIVNAGEKY